MTHALKIIDENGTPKNYFCVNKNELDPVYLMASNKCDYQTIFKYVVETLRPNKEKVFLNDVENNEHETMLEVSFVSGTAQTKIRSL